MPIVAVHMHLLPDGDVLMLGGRATALESFHRQFTAIESPALLFCSGHAFLPDGRLLISGGHISQRPWPAGGHDLRLANPQLQQWPADEPGTLVSDRHRAPERRDAYRRGRRRERRSTCRFPRCGLPVTPGAAQLGLADTAVLSANVRRAERQALHGGTVADLPLAQHGRQRPWTTPGPPSSVPRLWRCGDVLCPGKILVMGGGGRTAIRRRTPRPR